MTRKMMTGGLTHREIALLLSDGYFLVDGTIVKGWLSMSGRASAIYGINQRLVVLGMVNGGVLSGVDHRSRVNSVDCCGAGIGVDQIGRIADQGVHQGQSPTIGCHLAAAPKDHQAVQAVALALPNR